jgi:hypothetical protein
MSDSPNSLSWKECAAFLSLLILSRISIVLLLGFLVSGKEFTYDVDMHTIMVKAPFDMLTGQAARTQHPPFLPVMEAITVIPFQNMTSHFYSFRFGFVFYEVLGSFFVLLAIGRLSFNKKEKWWTMEALLLLPIGWITGTVMVQDEVISYFFMAVIVWLVVNKNYLAAILVCSLAVLAAKIFFLVPLLALIMVSPWSNIWVRSIAGFSPIVFVYSWVILMYFGIDGHIPLLGWSPNPIFTINMWAPLHTIFGLDLVKARNFSILLTLIAGCAPLFLLWIKDRTANPWKMTAVFTAMFLWVYIFFNHVNPEYYIILLPQALIIFRSKIEKTGLVILMSAPWAQNFFWGVEYAAKSGKYQGKKIFIDAYNAIFPQVDPSNMVTLSIFVISASTIVMAIIATKKLFEEKETIEKSCSP